MLVKLDNGVAVEWPVTVARIKHENPHVSFPSDTTKIDIAAYGYAKFAYSDKPDYDVEYQECVEIAPVLSGDTYVQAWEVKDKYTAEERAAYDATKEQKLLEELPAMHRSQRDNLLAETDWVVIKAQETGVAVDAAWATYRQALRDITTHANWPHLTEADWPVKP